MAANLFAAHTDDPAGVFFLAQVDPNDPAYHAMEPGMVGPFFRTPATKLGDASIKAMPKGPPVPGQ